MSVFTCMCDCAVVFTFTAFFINQAESSRAQTLVANPKVVADVRAAAVVVETLVGACRTVDKLYNRLRT